MLTRNRALDIVYIKNGDVIEQFDRMRKASRLDLESGPDAFLYDCLQKLEGRSVLLLSAAKSGRSVRHNEAIELQTFFREPSARRGVASRLSLFLKTLSLMFRRRPGRVLCGSTGEQLWASSLYCMLTRTPIVHSRHNRVSVGEGSVARRVTTALDNACIRRATGVVCHGPYLRKELLDIGLRPDGVLEFDVALETFRNGAASIENGLAYPDDRQTGVLYTGRIEELKGVFDLLEAVEPRLREDPDVVLLYAGEGAALGELKAAIVSRGLSPQVRCLGRVPHHALAGLMRRCKLAVTPSRSRFAEGRCMVAMESLAVGTPVIAPDFGPFPYLVEHGVNGLLFTPDSVGDLADKIRIALTDAALYEKLRIGARSTGDKLLVPPLTFGQAVDRAFALRAGT